VQLGLGLQVVDVDITLLEGGREGGREGGGKGGREGGWASDYSMGAASLSLCSSALALRSLVSILPCWREGGREGGRAGG